MSEKGEWEDLPEWKKRLIDRAESYFAQQIARGVLSFEVSREELHAHLSERAAHFASEAELAKDESFVPSWLREVISHYDEQTRHGLQPIGGHLPGDTLARYNDRQNEKEAAERRAAYIAERRRQGIEMNKVMGRRYKFMADHLPKTTKTFVIDLYQADQIGIIEDIGVAVGPRGGL